MSSWKSIAAEAACWAVGGFVMTRIISRIIERCSAPQKLQVLDLIGNTPLVYLKSLSRELGCEVYGKAEFLNPGGSVKDRVAKSIVKKAEDEGRLQEGGIVFEGTSGSTGISLALVCKALHYGCRIFMPCDIAKEKIQTLKALGAQVTLSPLVTVNDPNHCCTAAQAAAVENGGYYADQFENEANFLAHYTGTGEEIWKQTKGKVSLFVSGAGTGGTIAGVAARLKEYNSSVKVVLADPPGSAVLGKVKTGVLYVADDAEGQRRREIFDTVIEGVGLNRLTGNFELGAGLVDGGYRVHDFEAVCMSRYLFDNEGLFLGSSSAMNCCAVAKAVRDGVVPRGSTVVTLLCDSGMRHLSKFHNPKYLHQLGLLPAYRMNELNEEGEGKGNLQDDDGTRQASAVHTSAKVTQAKAEALTSPPTSIWDFVE